MYRDHRKGSGGPPGGATYPGGPHGLKWEGNQPLVGWCAPLGPPLCLGLGNPRGGGAPHLAWGGGEAILGRRPLEIHLPRAAAPQGPYIKRGEGGQPHPLLQAPPSPSVTPLLPACAWRSPVGILLHPPPRRRAAGSSSTSPSPLLDQEGGDIFPTVRVLNAEVPSVRREDLW